MPGPLARTLRRGAALSASGLVVAQAVSLAQTLVLARLLSPAELGVFAAGTVLTGVLLLVAEGGLRQALVQRPADEPDDPDDLEVAANTVFWATLAGGVLVACLALAAAPLVAAYFGDPLAGRVAAASAGALVLQSLGKVPDALMQRRFRFRRRAVVGPAVALAFAAAAIPLCALGAGMWGLVAGLYASELAWVATTWSLSGWRPGAARPSWPVWRELARFSSPVVGSAAADRVRQALEIALVGRLLGAAGLGLYRYGRRIGELPGRAVVEVGGFVLLPAFARISGDPERLRGAYLRALRAWWAVAVAAAALTAAAGTPAVVVLLGEPWRGAGEVVTAMAGWGPGAALLSVAGEAVKGAGHSRLLNPVSVLGLVAGPGLVLALAPFGASGVGLALSATYLLTGGVLLLRAGPVLGVGPRALAGPLVPPVLAGAVAAVATAALERGVLHSDRLGGWGIGPLLLDAVVLAVVYLAVLRAVAPATAAGLRAGVRR